MTIVEFKDLKSFGKENRIEIVDHARVTISRILKPMKNETRKANAYDFKYSIGYLYNGKEYVDHSRIYTSLKDLKSSIVPLFEQRNRQTRLEKEKSEKNGIRD